MMHTPVSNELDMPSPDEVETLIQLAKEWPSPADEPEVLANRFAHLLTLQLDQLPLPAGGRTLERWQRLSNVASLDLGLAKLFEGHTDAMAILEEISRPRRYPATARWAVWAAEPPFARLTLAPRGPLPMADGDRVVLNGKKAWCSGAHAVTHALVTTWYETVPYLAAVDLAQPGVRLMQSGWSAVGMAATASIEVEFADVEATLVGGAEAYLQRPGFWHGGIGVAACWWGGAVRIGDTLLAATTSEEPHRLAHLGMVDVVLDNGASRLRDAAAWIDCHPHQDARHLALSVRAAIDDIVSTVIEHAGRALGAGPYCRDAAFARMVADLPVFVRQAHAERDLEAIGRSLQQRARQNSATGTEKACAPDDSGPKHCAPQGWRLT
ncbi:acyl-CoA dehydrogenase [Salinicola sp. CPA57]|uniref:acyl-CoA dehydrogenase n=1 Tax=Salinicola sp. CPA57 TaxID=1949080 RepID=UPI0018E53DD7|nr:acyl-CoA dehydrogenase [Salinicola sp. CPA57]